MSHSGSFGVNYNRSYDATVIPSLPAKLMDLGSCPEGQFLFVQADGAIAQYDWVIITAAGQASSVTQTNDGSVLIQGGAAQVAAADNEYLWVWVGGVAGGGVGSGIKGKVAAGCVGGAAIYTTATAGVADDDATAPAVKFANVVTTVTTTPAAAVELYSVDTIRLNA